LSSAFVDVVVDKDRAAARADATRTAFFIVIDSSRFDRMTGDYLAWQVALR
jgi:hypothetical protein